MEKCLIVAVADNMGIGVGGDLPWHISEDLKYFKATTSGYPVIMGRTTYFSLPFRPLKGRMNIVLTHGEPIPGVTCVTCLTDAYARAEEAQKDKCFVMGGASVYKAAIDDMDRLYVTHVHTQLPQADVFMPEIDMSEWEVESRSEMHTDPENAYDFEFVVYKRRVR